MRFPIRGQNLLAALAVSAIAFAPCAANAQLKELEDVIKGRTLAGQAVKGLAVAYAVRQSSKQLDKFINTVTLRNHVPQHLATKVVPILSVGERGYIGGVQVVGPKAWVDKVQVVWQYEQGWNRGEYRVKALVPSSSLNPLQMKRVERVGMSALIDVSLGGGFEGNTRSDTVGLSRVIRASAIAGVVLVAAKPLNQFINTITFNKDGNTRVVPQVSVGETAYIGGSQVTGSSTTIDQVKAVFEYWDSFDKGRYRIRVLVPVNGIDPTKIKRVEGAGVVALIDTSIAAQKNVEKPRQPDIQRYIGERRGPIVIGRPRPPRHEDEDEDDDHDGHYRHDNGRHLGWYKNGKWDEKKRKEWEKEREKWEKEHEKDEREHDKHDRDHD